MWRTPRDPIDHMMAVFFLSVHSVYCLISIDSASRIFRHHFSQNSPGSKHFKYIDPARYSCAGIKFEHRHQQGETDQIRYQMEGFTPDPFSKPPGQDRLGSRKKSFPCLTSIACHNISASKSRGISLGINFPLRSIFDDIADLHPWC